MAFSISFASALTSFFICLLTRSIVARYYRSRVTLVEHLAYLLRVRRDRPSCRWPIRAPAPTRASPLTRIEGGKITPTAAPTGELASTGLGNSPLARLAAHVPHNVVSLQRGFHHPTGCFP